MSIRSWFSVLSAVALATVSCVAVAGATPVPPDSVTYTATPIATQLTNWNNSLTLPQFDSKLGCLDRICFTLHGDLAGSGKFESLDAGPTTVTLNLQATITLMRPDNTTLVITTPLVQTSDNVTAFDGTIDFGGTSGATHDGLSANSEDIGCSAAEADLALFTGTGNIVLPVSAVGASIGTGAGNLITQFSTEAGAGASVTYYYHQCPSPVHKTSWGQVRKTYR